MSESVQPTVITSYPHGETLVITAPLNVPVSAEALVANSTTVAALQAQIASLEARVTALEAAAA